MCTCNHCNTDMVRAKKGGNSLVHWFGIAFLALVGYSVFLQAPGNGIFIIALAVIWALGNRARSLMVCNKCGYFFKMMDVDKKI